MKKKAVKIIIDLGELQSSKTDLRTGRVEINKEPLIFEGKDEEELYRLANKELRWRSYKAPEKGNGYAKTDFTVIFEDGAEASMRYDVNSNVTIDIKREPKRSCHQIPKNILLYS